SLISSPFFPYTTLFRSMTFSSFLEGRGISFSPEKFFQIALGSRFNISFIVFVLLIKFFFFSLNFLFCFFAYNFSRFLSSLPIGRSEEHTSELQSRETLV